MGTQQEESLREVSNSQKVFGARERLFMAGLSVYHSIKYLMSFTKAVSSKHGFCAVEKGYLKNYWANSFQIFRAN